MRTIEIKLQDINRAGDYDFTFPSRPQRYASIEQRFPTLPLLVVDTAMRVVCGHDYLRLLLQRRRKNAVVLTADLDRVSALILNFNMLQSLFGLNLYEKLLFVKKTSAHCPLREIQRRAELDFSLNDSLMLHLGALLKIALRPLLASGRLALKSALRLLEFAATDQRALLNLFRACGFSESQQLQIMQMLEEIAFCEKRPLARTLAASGFSALLKLEMPQQKVLAALRALRYPACTRMENEWRRWQKEMAIPGRLALSHVPFFSGEEIQIFLTAKNRAEAEALLKKLK